MEYFDIYHPSNLFYLEETLAHYRPGGFHPVCLGDTFKDDRYRIHDKLGWGGYSTVWLAKDTRYVICHPNPQKGFSILLIYESRQQWVSIKIKSANSSKDSRELLHLQSLATNPQVDRYSIHMVQLLDHFFHKGPNGTHACLVFGLLGPTVDAVVADIHEGGDVLEPETILRMTRQLLQAVTFIHKAGYTHGGRFTAIESLRFNLAGEVFSFLSP